MSVRRGGQLLPKSLAALTSVPSFLPALHCGGTYLVLCGWLALLEPDSKCPGGCLLVLLDDIDAPGAFGDGNIVIWGWAERARVSQAATFTRHIHMCLDMWGLHERVAEMLRADRKLYPSTKGVLTPGERGLRVTQSCVWPPRLIQQGENYRFWLSQRKNFLTAKSM